MRGHPFDAAFWGALEGDMPEPLETADLFAWTLVIIVLSLALEGLLRRLLKGKGAAA